MYGLLADAKMFLLMSFFTNINRALMLKAPGGKHAFCYNWSTNCNHERAYGSCAL